MTIRGIDASWMLDAECAGMSSTTFFPEPGDMAAIRRARAVCARCRVKVECGEASKTEVYGIWSGTTPRERGLRRHR